MQTIVTNAVKAYFCAILIFGIKPTNKWLLNQLIKQQPKLMSYSSFTKQLTSK